MDRKAAKELLHIKGWLAPEGVDWALAVANRNFIIHQYDEINRGITWQTLSVDLPTWEASLQPLFAGADAALDDEAGSPTTTLGSQAAD